jgi:hypothetical protein
VADTGADAEAAKTDAAARKKGRGREATTSTPQGMVR